MIDFLKISRNVLSFPEVNRITIRKYKEFVEKLKKLSTRLMNCHYYYNIVLFGQSFDIFNYQKRRCRIETTSRFIKKQYSGHSNHLSPQISPSFLTSRNSPNNSSAYFRVLNLSKPQILNYHSNSLFYEIIIIVLVRNVQLSRVVQILSDSKVPENHFFLHNIRRNEFHLFHLFSIEVYFSLNVVLLLSVS